MMHYDQYIFHTKRHLAFVLGITTYPLTTFSVSARASRITAITLFRAFSNKKNSNDQK